MKHAFILVIFLVMVIGDMGCSSKVQNDSSHIQPPPHQSDATADLPGINKQRGLILTTSQATPGYIYFSPLFSNLTFLINQDGEVVHTWESDYSPSGGLYLLENGHLLRGAREPEVPRFGAGGQSGRIQEFNWDGEIVWEYLLANEERLLHHDLAILPNGNILAIAYEYISPEQAKNMGRKSELIPKAGLWTDMIIEIEPIKPDRARIVWEWHMIDHIIQDVDPNLEKYGSPSEFPQRIDINQGDPLPKTTAKELAKRKKNNQSPPNANLENLGSDLMHSNAIAYNASLDQIALSIHHYDEIWIIDHSTSWEESSGQTGGRAGKGGDILYRWGNPQIYGRGDETHQRLFGQHDIRWIPDGMPGAGNLMVFNNQRPGENGNYSSVFEWEPPLQASMSYYLDADLPYGPDQPLWSYTASDTASFFAPFISGAHRISNGHTFITSGPQGRFFEVTPSGDIVWEYWTPYSGDVRLPDGSTPQPVGPFIYGTFRATHIPLDHPALLGKKLEPLDPQPTLHAQ